MGQKKKYLQYSEDFLRQVLQESYTYGECCDKLGYCRNSHGYAVIREISKKYNIDISHFGLYKDIKGQKFGSLTALEFNRVETQKRKRATWLCKCDCGNELFVIADNLLTGHTQSCGCYHKKRISEEKRLDLNGQRFGKLLVLEVDEEKTKQYGRVYRKCQCDCGNIISVFTARLTANNGVRSCGCEKSKGELKIKELLNNLNISFIAQWTAPELKFNNPLRCDFALFENLTDAEQPYSIIEFQGEQHYKAFKHFGGDERLEIQQKRDNIKRDYCESHNIKLIEIPYWDYNKLNEDYLLNLINS